MKAILECWLKPREGLLNQQYRGPFGKKVYYFYTKETESIPFPLVNDTMNRL